MRHHKAMAIYDCLKFINEALFSVLVIGLSVLLASRGVISVGTVLTAYLCFTQLTGPLRELHRILDEFSESTVLAQDYFQMVDLPLDFSYEPIQGQAPRQLENNRVDLQDVCFAYPEKPEQQILWHISLAIQGGAFIGVAGPSGCGKSSLIKVIDKLEQAQGQICLGGRAHCFHHPGDLGKKRGHCTSVAFFGGGYGLSQHLLRHEGGRPFGGGSGGSSQSQHCGGH